MLTPADSTTYEDVACWFRHFYRSESGGDALAQQIRRKLESLHASMASLAADPEDGALDEAAATLEIRRARAGYRNTPPDSSTRRRHGFGLEQIKSRCLPVVVAPLEEACRRDPISARRADIAFRRELERRRVRREIEDAVRVLGISLERINLGGAGSSKPAAVIDRLTNAYLVCKVIAKCPRKGDKPTLLRRGDRDAVLRYVRDNAHLASTAMTPNERLETHWSL